jgi:hypothetical protein
VNKFTNTQAFVQQKTLAAHRWQTFDGMRKEDSSDPWLNQSRTPLTAWEKALRPLGPSNRGLFLLAAAAAALAALVALNDWRDSGPLRIPAERQAAPAAPPSKNASPALRYDQRELKPESTSRVQRFAKCISPAGAATYTDGSCPADARASEVSVTPDVNLAEGMSQDARQASMRRNSAIAQSVLEHERQVAMNVDSSSTECAQLNALIASIDAAARQPQSGLEQDRLKDQRRRARDRQFALHCR